MVRKQNGGEVPKWVSDFIARRIEELITEHRQRQQEDSIEWRVQQYSPLVCPFSAAEEEEVRAAMYERRARMSPQPRPIVEMGLREILLVPLATQQMQETVAKYYGWKEWTEDPWGNNDRFIDWLSSCRDNERAVWAINNTVAGRVYLKTNLLYTGSQCDYLKMPPDQIMSLIGNGAGAFLCLKAFSGWEYLKYPYVPLPANFVNDQILTVYWERPLFGYISFLSSIYLWDFALKELTRRLTEAPQDVAYCIDGLLGLTINDIPNVLKYIKALQGEDYVPPDKDESWEKIEGALRRWLVGKTVMDPLWASSLRAVFPLVSPLKDSIRDEDGNYKDLTLYESYVEGETALLKATDYWKKQDFISAGLKGRLVPSIKHIVKNELVNSMRAVSKFRYTGPLRPPRRQPREIPESYFNYPGTLRADGDVVKPLDYFALRSARKEGNARDSSVENAVLGNTITDEKGMEATAIKLLENLKMGLDKLTPRERFVFEDFIQAYKEGYYRNSKRGRSLSQRWGKDYERNMKAFNRAKLKFR